MARFNLCGGSDTRQSPTTNVERTRNWLPEINGLNAKSKISLVPRGGLTLFADLGDQPIRGMLFQNGGMGVASGQSLWQVAQDGTFGEVGNIGGHSEDPVTFGATQQEVLIGSADKAFLWAADGLKQVLNDVAMVGQTDGYFIALVKGSDRFRISALFDGSSWDDLDVAQVSLFPGNIRSMLVDHREIWLFGDKNSVPYYNAGDPDFPFFPVLNGFIELGIGAKDSAVRIDNTICWLDADERGGGVARRAQGYLPSRISTHAEEQIWRTYSRIDDAIGMTLQWNGHALWLLYFPSVGLRAGTQEKLSATWVYDIATDVWTEWTWMDPQTGLEEGFVGRCHVYAPDWNQHFFGDRRSGKIYRMSTDALDDAGDKIRFSRTSPYIADEKRRILHSLLELDAEAGLATIQDPDGTYRAPQVMMRFSDNDGKTWSNEQKRGLGLAGEYKTRQRWLRLGQSRGRVYEIAVTDPCSPRITDGYVEAS